jgi:hypothetical protein
LKPIGLTGDPTAQDAVGLQLAALTTQRGLALRLFLGVKTPTEAHHIHDEGGEIWHCGPHAPDRALLGHVDRVVTGATFEEIAVPVARSLAEMLNKQHLSGEPA